MSSIRSTATRAMRGMFIAKYCDNTFAKRSSGVNSSDTASHCCYFLLCRQVYSVEIIVVV